MIKEEVVVIKLTVKAYYDDDELDKDNLKDELSQSLMKTGWNCKIELMDPNITKC